MTKSIFSRAAHRADQVITSIADRFNGNAGRRRATPHCCRPSSPETHWHTQALRPPPLAR